MTNLEDAGGNCRLEEGEIGGSPAARERERRETGGEREREKEREERGGVRRLIVTIYRNVNQHHAAR